MEGVVCKGAVVANVVDMVMGSKETAWVGVVSTIANEEVTNVGTRGGVFAITRIRAVTGGMYGLSAKAVGWGVV